MSPRIFAIALALCAPPLLAAGEAAPAAQSSVSAIAGSATPDLGSTAIQMVLGLIVVLAFLLGALWLLKRISQPRGVAAGFLRVVAGVTVGPRERVVIIEMGESWLVLGVAPGQVSILAEIPRQEMPPPARSIVPADFVGQLAARLRKNA